MTATTTALNINSPNDWANAQLEYMGLPDTPSNVAFLVGWYNREGGNWANTARFNPLNTTLQVGQSTSINSVGVQAYGSWATGLYATAQTLAGYPQILAALATGNASSYSTSGALASDLLKWSGHGYSTVTPSSGATTATLASKSIWDWIRGSANSAASTVGPGALATGPPPIAKTIGSVTDFLNLLAQKGTWIRVAEVAGGLVLGALGLVLLARAIGPTGAAAAVTGILPTPVGRAVGAVASGKSPAANRSGKSPAANRSGKSPAANRSEIEQHRSYQSGQKSYQEHQRTLREYYRSGNRSADEAGQNAAYEGGYQAGRAQERGMTAEAF